ncbi:MAG: energy-coupling factor transporter transmembrane component T [Polyangia bacterium]
MKTSWHDIWGSARGPVKRLVPQARLICGVSVFASCMFAAVTRWEGAVAITLVVVAWTALVRPPIPVLRSTLLFGLVLFLPYFLLVPLIRDSSAGRGWIEALAVSWTVFFRGMTAMLVSVCTATALSASALRRGLSRLPVPRVFSAVLIQIVHQTTNLVYETRRIASAIAVRGGTTGYLTGLRVLASLPRVWLPRVVERTERVGAAMELRGYCELDPAELGSLPTAWRDRSAIGLALATLAGTAALRIWGGF